LESVSSSYIGFINPTKLCYGSIYAAVDGVHEKALVQVNVYFLVALTFETHI